jgi:hypothetical protein
MGLQDHDRVIQEAYNTESAVPLDDVKVLEESRRKLCQQQPVERKRWRFW